MTTYTSSSAQDDARSAQQRIGFAALSVVLVLVFGSLGYYILGGGEWSLLDCVYMTVITLTTVGYGETIPISGHPEAMVFTLILLVMGMGVMLYFVSSLTAFIIDGQLQNYIKGKRMLKTIARLKDHHIVCGLHGPGEFVVEELLISKAPMVLIEQKPHHIERLQQKLGFAVPHIIGDATDDSILLEAGIKRCVGTIVTLGNDRDNLFCTITARTLNPTMRIITQGDDPRSEE
ncbi:MAG: NAD-binding protein, partial [Myxococcota bacterium]